MAKFDPKSAYKYRLRMVCLDWYLFLFGKTDEKLGALGPFSYSDAKLEAGKLEEAGVKDWDKLA